jgi:hypothetical protein
MIREALLILVGAFAARADDANRAVEIALANALARADARAAQQLFAPKMASGDKIRSDLEQLVRNAGLSLEIDSKTGLWTLRIISNDVAAGTTRRAVNVSLQVTDGRITSFAPADFFEPPHGEGAWNAVYVFAAALNDGSAPPALGLFDPKMPGFADFKNGVTALWTRYQIDSSLDLESNEGDDAHRTLQIDWTLTLANQQDPVDSSRREQTVVCRVEKQAKGWRIVNLEPAGFFETK